MPGPPAETTPLGGGEGGGGSPECVTIFHPQPEKSLNTHTLNP